MLKDLMKNSFLCRFMICLTAFLSQYCIIVANDDTQYAGVMRQATVYEEADMLDQAIEIYQGLLKGELSSEQQSLLRYNIGTLYLEKHEFDKAIAQFIEVDQSTSNSPLLLSRLYRNLGIAYYLRGMQSEKDQSQSLPFDDFKEVLYDLRAALSAFSKESTADCALRESNETNVCSATPEVTSLENQVKIAIATLETKAIEKGAGNLPLEEEIPWLYDSINNLIIKINFTGNPDITGSEKTDYFHLFSAEQSAWEPLWKFSEAKLQELEKNSKDKEAYRLFIEAKEKYVLGVQQTNNGQLEQASKSLIESKDSLAALMKKIYADDPLRLNLYRLLGMYQRLSISLNFTEAQLDNINDAYEQLQESISPGYKELQKDSGQVQESIKNSQALLKLSMQSLKEHFHTASLLYLYGAMQEVQEALFDIQKTTPLQTLERIIFQQKFALKMNGRIIGMPTQEASQELLKLPITAQKKVVETISLFWETLKSEQTRQFQNEGICQSSPWGTTLPLFEKGSLSAKMAMEYLGSISSDPARALSAQQNAVDSWESTLSELKHPHDDPRSGCHQGSSSSSESDQKNEAPQNQLLQTLQQMYLDDQPSKKDQPAVKSGERPW